MGDILRKTCLNFNIFFPSLHFEKELATQLISSFNFKVSYHSSFPPKIIVKSMFLFSNFNNINPLKNNMNKLFSFQRKKAHSKVVFKLNITFLKKRSRRSAECKFSVVAFFKLLRSELLHSEFEYLIEIFTFNFHIYFILKKIEMKISYYLE